MAFSTELYPQQTFCWSCVRFDHIQMDSSEHWKNLSIWSLFC